MDRRATKVREEKNTHVIEICFQTLRLTDRSPEGESHQKKLRTEDLHLAAETPCHVRRRTA